MIGYFGESWVVVTPLGLNGVKNLTELCGHWYRCSSGMKCTLRGASTNEKCFHLSVLIHVS